MNITLYKLTGSCKRVEISNKVTTNLLKFPINVTKIRTDFYKLINTFILVKNYYIKTIPCINFTVKFRRHKKKIKYMGYNVQMIISKPVRKREVVNEIAYIKKFRLKQREIQRLYRIKNLEKIKKYKNSKIKCKYCNDYYSKSNFAKHKRTLKHLNNFKNMT